ncbi:MAG: MerR family transcriptional regulator [Acidobacteria bacterium]|nr:MerR family transcriptional regulator [Acidobacteriota bacterium]MCB9377979.1 MerR family transcriptional regulator [Holophagales bacterium]
MSKRVYKLAEVCKLLELQPYVLRFWETEFPPLQDGDAKASVRGYSQEDVDLLRRIKRLLYEEGYTIAGAKKKLESEPRAAASPLFDEPEATESGEEERAEEPAEEADRQLDTAARERIELLQRGLAEALEEARAVLALLNVKRR